MKEKEIEEWVKSATYVDCDSSEYDSNGNHEVSRIHEKDGKLYRIYYCNDSISPKWGDKGYMSERDEEGVRIKDEYGRYIYIFEPQLVRKETKTITKEVTEYITVSEN